jgi:8-oxo-dGTP pyrophosphatase MutT (NUDIX family)
MGGRGGAAAPQYPRVQDGGQARAERRASGYPARVRLDDIGTLLRRRLLPAEVPAGDPVHAAVAGVLREGESGAEILLIERVQRIGDPWSGQMALPGGRVQREDRSPLETAIRETQEETGVALPYQGVLGRLEEQAPSSSGGALRVAGFVFALRAAPELRPNQSEVADALWLPLQALLEHSRYRDYAYPSRPGLLFPAVAVDVSEDPRRTEARVVWGLTLRFLSDLFARLGHAFPPGREVGASRADYPSRDQTSSPSGATSSSSE